MTVICESNSIISSPLILFLSFRTETPSLPSFTFSPLEPYSSSFLVIIKYNAKLKPKIAKTKLVILNAILFFNYFFIKFCPFFSHV
jgi:hypothetical protein